MKSGSILGAILAAAALVSTAPSLSAAKEKPIEEFTAFAASLGTGRAGIVHITLYRWSTDGEREMLLSTLQEFGRDKLVDTLQKIKPRVGFIRPPNTRGWDLYYARDHRAADGTRRIVLASDRPVSFREVSNRSMDYRVSVIEIHLDANGKGEGKLVEAAKLTWDKDSKKLEIEGYAALPVDLLQVKTEKAK